VVKDPILTTRMDKLAACLIRTEAVLSRPVRTTGIRIPKAREAAVLARE
jgi:hypothetical protein